MTEKEAVDIAFAASRRERQSRFDRICRLRGFCQTEPLEKDVGGWTWCPDCLTLFDDYEKPLNRLPEESTSRYVH